MNIEQLAKTLDKAAKTATAIPQLSAVQPYDLEQAYKIQAASIGERIQRGEQMVGYKMGFTSKAKMEQMGVSDLIWGRLTDQMQFKDGDTISRKNFIHPRAEPEIAFLISKDIQDSVTIENVKDYVSHVAVAIEIIDSRYENFKFSLEDVVADNCSSSAFAIGHWKSLDVNIENILMSIVFDDVIKGRGNSNAIMGNPWQSLVDANRLTLENGATLKEGQIVLAGAATAAQHIQKGITISAHAEGLGSVFLDVE